ncbi:hypothetical protein [Rhizobium sp. H4]|uniref:hypothetical protein n=1 Tax=Rhizobium sp. H4 TaxID=2035449 RepID=UPI000D0F4F07|nr:hypothetical protein [Rhizobium sp. H4]
MHKEELDRVAADERKRLPPSSLTCGNAVGAHVEAKRRTVMAHQRQAETVDMQAASFSRATLAIPFAAGHKPA